MNHISGRESYKPSGEKKSKAVVINLESKEGLSATYDALDRCLIQNNSDPNKTSDALEDDLVDVLQYHAPEIAATLMEVRQELDHGLGFAVVQNTGVDKVRPELAQLMSITMSRIYGRPTRTDRQKSQIAWPIHFNPEAKGVKTFSQTMNEATYHTDTQYFATPEEYFALFCVVSDEQGKGTNTLIDGLDIAKQIDEDLPHVSRVLKRDYPFRVPTVFTSSGNNNDIELIQAPIFTDDGKVRYRRDTLMEAAALPEVGLSEEQMQAIDVLEEYLKQAQTYEHHLQPGEAIFINNHRLLHARTPYDNPDRLLYRVRMRDDRDDE